MLAACASYTRRGEVETAGLANANYLSGRITDPGYKPPSVYGGKRNALRMDSAIEPEPSDSPVE